MLTLSDPFLELSIEWEPATYLVNQCHHPHAWYSVVQGATNCSQFLLVFAENMKLNCFSIFENFLHVSSNLSSCWLPFSCHAYNNACCPILFFFPSYTSQNHLEHLVPRACHWVLNQSFPLLIKVEKLSPIFYIHILYTEDSFKMKCSFGSRNQFRVVIHNHFQVLFCSTAINSSFFLLYTHFPLLEIHYESSCLFKLVLLVSDHIYNSSITGSQQGAPGETIPSLASK